MHYPILGAILVAGLVVRCWGISFGLPNLHCRPDESTLVNKALAMGTGDLNPHFFNYPSFHFYLLAVIYGLFFLGGWTCGRFSGTEDFQYLYFTDPSIFYLIGRIGSAVLGTASIALVYLIGRRTGGPLCGLLSAFFLCLAFLHARDSHFLTVDIPATCYMLIGLFFALRYLEDPTWGALIGGGIGFGLAASTKYNAGLFGIALLVAVWLAAERPWRRTAVALGTMGLAFLAGTPFALLDFGGFWRDLSYERAHFLAGHGGMDLAAGAGWLHHLSFSLFYGLGWPLLIAGGLGVVWMIYRRRPSCWVLLAGLFFYYAIAGSGRGVFMRYMLPVVPVLCVSAGLLSSLAIRRFGRGFAFLALLLVVPSAGSLVRHDALLVREDTRLQATRWIERELPSGTWLGMHGSDFGYPQVRRSREWLVLRLEDDRRAGLGDRRLAAMLALKEFPPEPSYYVLELKAENPLGRRSIWTSFDPDRLRRNGVEWIVTHEHPLAYSQVDPQFQEQLDGAAVLVTEFDPFSGDRDGLVYEPIDAYYAPLAGYDRVERPGPLIRIYRLRP